jgi:hypothetical protein
MLAARHTQAPRRDPARRRGLEQGEHRDRDPDHGDLEGGGVVARGGHLPGGLEVRHKPLEHDNEGFQHEEEHGAGAQACDVGRSQDTMEGLSLILAESP